jgi:type II secretory pathway pseudopilin PulG
MESRMPQSRQPVDRHAAHKPAFTIVELLVSITVIFLIVTTALVGLRAARKGAERTVSLSALRQMMTGYSAYTADHKGRLLPGYVKPTMIGDGANQLDIKAKLKDGTKLNADDTASYVWRLAPYLDHEWRTFMADYGSDSIITRMVSEYDAGNYGPGSGGPNIIGIASHPSFGLNSIFVGGDSNHGPNGVVGGNPWSATPSQNVATRMSHPKNPSKLIVFAPTQAATQPTGLAPEVTLGYPELRAPFTQFSIATGGPTTPDTTRQWFIEGTEGPNQGKVLPDPGNFSAPGGLPIDRLGDKKITTAHLDGSTTLVDIGELGPSTANMNTANMSLWIPTVVSSN